MQADRDDEGSSRSGIRRILSIDGGGIKGMFAAAFLAEFEEKVGQPLHRRFDLIAGTSTGGIIALGLGLGIPAADIQDLYERRGPEIFYQDRGGVRGGWDRKAASLRHKVLGPKHKPDRLLAALTEVLGDRRFGEAKTRLLIPSFHRALKKVYVFKTAHHERFGTDYKELARDVGMVTAAAPTYLPEFVTSRGVGLVDGGMWANNPTGIAVVEAIGTLGWAPDELRVLSVGALNDVSEMPSAPSALSIVHKTAGYFMAGQSHGSLGMAKILTGDVGGADRRRIWRIDQPIEAGTYALDGTDKLQALKSRALFQAREEIPNLLPVFGQAVAEPFTPVHRIAA